MHPPRYFLGVHTGRASLRGCLVAQDGCLVASDEKRFRNAASWRAALLACIAELRRAPGWEAVAAIAVAIEKSHGCAFPSRELQALRPEGVPLLCLPAPMAVMLGAIPGTPSLLVSLGAELRLATLDSAHNYREYRLQEGGGIWWTHEFTRLAPHSAKLQRALIAHPSATRLTKAVPELLHYAEYPAPDPVLKARLDGLCRTIAESCLGLASRQPGVRLMSTAGYLASSPMGRRIVDGCAGYLEYRTPRFPPEVGAALVSLAVFTENQERALLGKAPETGQLPSGVWGLPASLLRRLPRIRRPFERYPRPSAP